MKTQIIKMFAPPESVRWQRLVLESIAAVIVTFLATMGAIDLYTRLW